MHTETRSRRARSTAAQHRLIEAPVLAVLRRLPGASCHGAICPELPEPSREGGVSELALWIALASVLWPGGWVVAFGTPLTHHRRMLAMETAGLSLVDVLAWPRGGGWAPAILARKPGPRRPLSPEMERQATGWLPGAAGSALAERALHQEGERGQGGRTHRGVGSVPAAASMRGDHPSRSGPRVSGGLEPQWLGVPPTATRSPYADLARLIWPPEGPVLAPRGGRLLLPFCGAGEAMVGAIRAGWGQVVGIEEDRERVAGCYRRLGELVREQRAAEAGRLAARAEEVARRLIQQVHPPAPRRGER